MRKCLKLCDHTYVCDMMFIINGLASVCCCLTKHCISYLTVLLLKIKVYDITRIFKKVINTVVQKCLRLWHLRRIDKEEKSILQEAIGG